MKQSEYSIFMICAKDFIGSHEMNDHLFVYHIFMPFEIDICTGTSKIVYELFLVCH